MAAESEDTGFLSRWSRRKVEVREGMATGGVMATETPAATPAVTAPTPPAPPAHPASTPPRSAAAEPEPASPEECEPPPTLADVAALTRDSDYSRFMVPSVQPDIKNAALAKLFTDPHFNVMDGLDVYIDDYGKPDPLPPGMLRQMFQSQVLGLFDDEEEDGKKAALDGAAAPLDAGPATDPATDPAAEPTAEPAAVELAALTADPTAPHLPDENTDLQLQPDDDAGRPSVAPGAVENPGRAH